MGAGSCRETVFDVPRLELQALKYLQLEESLATNNKQVRLQIQFKTVVASCCYLQYKQAEQDEIDVQEVFKMCKILGVKPGKALDFLNKWGMKLDQGKFDETFDIVRFSKEVKKRQPDTEDKLRQKKERAMERKKEWLEKNREAMNSRKRELYAEKKALKQQQMYSRFKIALT